MQQLIIKNDIEQSKIDALLQFLKSWDIDAEFKSSSLAIKKKDNFSLSAGMWKDYDLNASELRNQAWNRK